MIILFYQFYALPVHHTIQCKPVHFSLFPSTMQKSWTSLWFTNVVQQLTSETSAVPNRISAKHNQPMQKCARHWLNHYGKGLVSMPPANGGEVNFSKLLGFFKMENMSMEIMFTPFIRYIWVYLFLKQGGEMKWV